MDDIKQMLIKMGYGSQVEMCSFVNAIDDRFGEGSGHRNKAGKSWGDVTEDNWENDPEMRYLCKGNNVEILGAYADLRRSGVRGWISITTDDWQCFFMWKPQI